LASSHKQSATDSQWSGDLQLDSDNLSGCCYATDQGSVIHQSGMVSISTKAGRIQQRRHRIRGCTRSDRDRELRRQQRNRPPERRLSAKSAESRCHAAAAALWEGYEPGDCSGFGPLYFVRSPLGRSTYTSLHLTANKRSSAGLGASVGGFSVRRRA